MHWDDDVTHDTSHVCCRLNACHKCCLLQVLIAFMVGMTNLYTYYGNNPYAEKGGQPNFRVIESFEGCVQKMCIL